jgi:UDP-N-acetylmuramyl pentapeptide phosphotransferase/UDP-N-acetylglucosamine-1-phosphate transferase
VVGRVAGRIGLVAYPKRDRWHRTPTPLLGGVAIYTGTLIVILGLARVDARLLGLLVGGSLLFVAGLVDDLTPSGPRGLRGHLAALTRGNVSTGIVKLFVVGAAALLVVAAGPERGGAVRISGVILIAGAANLWNGLDVRPARALKFSYPAFLAVGAFAWALAPFVPGVAVAALLILPWDAGERAMLGDAGANLLGFSVGTMTYYSLPNDAIWVAALMVVILTVAAETVTLSRLIAAVPPLRWYDRIGRLPG